MGIIEQKLTLRADTHNYTRQDIINELEECRAIMLSLGYMSAMYLMFTVRIATNLSKTMGKCQMDIKDKAYTIVISDKAIKYASPERLHNIIMHEFLHAMPGAMNHGPVWKGYAAAVNRNYKYTPIQRVSNDEEYHDRFYNDYRASLNKYRIECKGCGTVWKYKKLCSTVRACQRGAARCSKCGSKSFNVTYKV